MKHILTILMMLAVSCACQSNQIESGDELKRDETIKNLVQIDPSDRVLSFQTQVFIHDPPWAIVLKLLEESMKQREGVYQIGEGENTFSAKIHHGPYIDRFVRVPAGPATPPIPDNDPRYSKWNAESGRVSCRLLHPEKDERYPAVEIQVHDLRFDRFRIENIGPFRTDLGVPVRP